MAFESIPGVRVTLKDAGRTFIVSDFFSVYEKGEEFPEIHRWSEVEAILETKTDFVVSSKDFSYKIPKTALSDPRKLLNLRGVFEGAVSQYPEIEYTHPKRVLPPKYLYMSGDVKDPPYMASGTYREREINFS
ncbi:MAG: hypothetical protein FWH20_05640, partial [Oscillospiraceae bacterium]|nr:hypothetical protein [Oscillospiraceae bacterium]